MALSVSLTPGTSVPKRKGQRGHSERERLGRGRGGKPAGTDPESHRRRRVSLVSPRTSLATTLELTEQITAVDNTGTPHFLFRRVANRVHFLLLRPSARPATLLVWVACCTSCWDATHGDTVRELSHVRLRVAVAAPSSPGQGRRRAPGGGQAGRREKAGLVNNPTNNATPLPERGADNTWASGQDHRAHI